MTASDIEACARRGGALTRMIAAALACAVATGGAAHADGWSVLGFLSQRFEADSNLRLDPASDQEAFGSTTTGRVSFASRTSRTELSLSPGFRATGFTGAGANSSQNLIAPSFAGAFSHRVAAVDFSGGLRLDIRPTAFSDLDQLNEGVSDPDLVDQNATAISISANSGIGYQIDGRNRATIGSIVSLSRFTDDADALTPNTTIGVNTGLSHAVNAVTSADVGAGVRRVKTGGARDETSIIFDIDAGARTEIDPGFTLGGRVGLNFTDTERVGGASDSGVGFSFSLTSGYAVSDDLRIGLSASQALEPGVNGDLQDRLRIGANGTWAINPRESVSLGLTLSRQNGGSTAQDGDSRTLTQATLGYQLAITPDLTANLGYAFRWRPDDGAEATSHKISLTISRAFPLQP